jgi:hypothetical protein
MYCSWIVKVSQVNASSKIIDDDHIFPTSIRSQNLLACAGNHANSCAHEQPAKKRFAAMTLLPIEVSSIAC